MAPPGVQEAIHRARVAFFSRGLAHGRQEAALPPRATHNLVPTVGSAVRVDHAAARAPPLRSALLTERAVVRGLSGGALPSCVSVSPSSASWEPRSRGPEASIRRASRSDGSAPRAGPAAVQAGRVALQTRTRVLARQTLRENPRDALMLFDAKRSP